MRITRRSAITVSFGVIFGGYINHLSAKPADTMLDLTHRDVSMHPCFSDSYKEARRKFVTSATEAGATLETFRLPDQNDIDGTPLFMDFAWLGPTDADVILLSLSGTHGAEGYPGSAAQTDWFKTYRSRKLPDKTAVLFVHAVNPFGFSRNIRENENGVNLNRNFINFDKFIPENRIFDEIYPTLPVGNRFDPSLIEQYDLAVADAKKRYGVWEVSDAFGRGQYSHPLGEEYGGDKLQWSSGVLIKTLKRLCRNARHVAYIDWHSLIPIGDGNLVFLCFNQTKDPLFNRAASWWSEKAIDRDAVNKQWSSGVSVRRPSRTGLVMWGIQRALAPHTDVAGAVIEFCCDPDQFIKRPQESSQDFLLSQWLRTTGSYNTPHGRFVSRLLREASSPTRRSFQDAAILAARTAYCQALEGAGRWAQEHVPATPGRLVSYSDFT